jgi:pyruvate kinase
MASSPNHRRAARLLADLRKLREEVAREGAAQLEAWRPRIARTVFLPDAENLALWLALRRRDLRGIQLALMPFGVSSLGRCDSRVLANLDAVVRMLAVFVGEEDPGPRESARFFEGMERLRTQTDALFGGSSPRRVRIMATLADDTPEAVVSAILHAGADAVRINCAHGDVDGWAQLLERVRHGAATLGQAVSVCMDLGGPRCRLGDVRLVPDARRLFPGDRFFLGSAFVDPLDFPAQALFTLPEVLPDTAEGQRVFIDEGRLEGVVESARPGGVVVRVVRVASAKGFRLRADKGVNLPDTPIRVGALTRRDRADLDFVAAHADIVGHSFVRSAGDVDELNAELEARAPERGRDRPGLIAKIETADAIAQLPEIVVAAAGRRPFGVMIARGDLAVEIGWPRLAEIQEEILWLCEAARVPVVWATQVMDQLVHKGLPSRAEITDAAMAERAECVMLNQGPYAAEAIRLLVDVFARMEAHQDKKTSRLRALHAWNAAPGAHAGS